jgi:two-component system chemotaxis response regulator CheY
MKRIWIVDDDEEMTRAVQLMLKLIGCDPTGFFNARSATEALLSGKLPDLMILDINMPEVSGLDLLEYIRRRTEWNNMPVIMLSTEAADVTVDKAIKLGANGYVTKPVTIEELERVIESALKNH